MNHTEALKCILKRTGLSQKKVADRLGLRSGTTVSMRMNRETVRLYNIVELLDAMGYEMVAMPKNCPPLPEDAYAIRREDYP
jgi:transcriptional regulator with XRE-family HTH domain